MSKIEIALASSWPADFWSVLVRVSRSMSAKAIFSDVNKITIRGKIVVRHLDAQAQLRKLYSKNGEFARYEGNISGVEEQGAFSEFASESAQVVQKACRLLGIKFFTNPREFIVAKGPRAVLVNSGSIFTIWVTADVDRGGDED